MRSYVRESRKIDENTRIITHYTLTESIILNILKLLFFLFFLWPIQLFWFVFKTIITLPFKGIARFYKSSFSTKTKVIVTVVVLGLLIIGGFIVGAGNGN